jgi:hypothetical protein
MQLHVAVRPRQMRCGWLRAAAGDGAGRCMCAPIRAAPRSYMLDSSPLHLSHPGRGGRLLCEARVKASEAGVSMQ